MKKLLTFIAIMSMTLTFAQTSKAEVQHIIKEQSDGKPGQQVFEGTKAVYNDSKSAITTVYSDVKSLSPKVESAVKSLATQFKTTTNALWDILVKQQLVWSICFLILTIASLVNWWLFYKRNINLKEVKYEKIIITKKVRKLLPPLDRSEEDITNYSHLKPQYKDIDEEDVRLIPIPTSNIPNFKYLHLVICLTLSVFSFWHFSDMLTGFINPEFGALKTIVEVATKLK